MSGYTNWLRQACLLLSFCAFLLGWGWWGKGCERLCVSFAAVFVSFPRHAAGNHAIRELEQHTKCFRLAVRSFGTESKSSFAVLGMLLFVVFVVGTQAASACQDFRHILVCPEHMNLATAEAGELVKCAEHCFCCQRPVKPCNKLADKSTASWVNRELGYGTFHCGRKSSGPGWPISGILHPGLAKKTGDTATFMPGSKHRRGFGRCKQRLSSVRLPGF